MALHAARGIEVNGETLAFDAIKKAGPGGNFMTDPGTVKHMRLEHYIPKLANRDEQGKWLKSDAPDLRRKSSDFVREILSKTFEHRLDRTLVETLTADYPELTVPGELTKVANR
jgi:trimethylamine--corrinoid protein Co-methyltransferase